MDYPEKLVAFLDVLGFSELISRAGEPPGALTTIRLLEDLLKKEGAWDWKSPEASIRMFSDSVCMSDAPDLGGFIRLIIKLWLMQAGFLKAGILVRGGVSLGRHYESDTLMFSAGLVSAYRLEAGRAIYPRIIIDRPVLKRYLVSNALNPKDAAVIRGLLLQDVDQEVFVNYLGVHSETDSAWEGGRKRLLGRQAQLITEGRAKFRDNPKIMQKLGWLERYHNFVVSNTGAGDDLVVGAGAYGFSPLQAERSG